MLIDDQISSSFRLLIFHQFKNSKNKNKNKKAEITVWRKNKALPSKNKVCREE